MAAIKWIQQNWFLAGLLTAVLLAWLFPAPGASGGVLHSAQVTRLGIILIFFLQGLTLSLAVLKAGLMQWRLHLLVQIFIFLIIPLLALAMVHAAAPLLSEELKLGFIFLAVLPTTVATCVAYTAMVGGNIAGAVFNSTLANMAGVVITPLWISMWRPVDDSTSSLSKLLLDVSLLLLVPMLAGQVCRPLIGRLAERHKKRLAILTSLILLFIVYSAFCNSWKQNIWSSQGGTTIGVAAAGAVLLFGITVGLTAAAVRIFRFDQPNARAALFCATQKTLAAGAPLANLIFASHPGLGLILLPLMLYHPLQLLAGGLLINRIKKNRRALTSRGSQG